MAQEPRETVHSVKGAQINKVLPSGRPARKSGRGVANGRLYRWELPGVSDARTPKYRSHYGQGDAWRLLSASSRTDGRCSEEEPMQPERKVARRHRRPWPKVNGVGLRQHGMIGLAYAIAPTAAISTATFSNVGPGPLQIRATAVLMKVAFIEHPSTRAVVRDGKTPLPIARLRIGAEISGARFHRARHVGNVPHGQHATCLSTPKRGQYDARS